MFNFIHRIREQRRADDALVRCVDAMKSERAMVLDNLAWQVEQALRAMPPREQRKAIGVLNGTPMCPFCSLFVPESECQPVGDDFFGSPVSIGGIRSCGDCAALVKEPQDAEEMVAMLKQQEGAN